MKKTVRMAVVGIRSTSIGNHYAETIAANPDAELAAICDTNEECIRERGAFYGLAPENVYTDFYEMIKREDIDAVCIVTPDQFHKDYVTTALRAGKDVLCEKPMALSGDDCKEMIDVSDETGKKLMIGQICRFTPGFVLAKELIDAGEIGEISFIESEYAHKYENISTGWRYADPDRNVVVGGGCHAVDLIRWLAGDPVEVSAYANKMINDQWLYPDTTIAALKFKSGAIGKVMISGGSKRAYTMRTCIHGTKGSIIVDNKSPQMSLFKDTFEGESTFHHIVAHNIEIKLPVQIKDHNVGGEVDHFINVCLGKEEMKIDGIEGCNTVIVSEAIVNSSKSGQKIRPQYKTRKA